MIIGYVNGQWLSPFLQESVLSIKTKLFGVKPVEQRNKRD